MRHSPGNPTNNTLSAGTNEKAFLEAIAVSGYPLQSVVASKLLSRFGITEEWGYTDRDTKDNRTLDVFAYKKLESDPPGKMAHDLVLLIECKRSVHPFVFFKTVTDRAIPGFPGIAAYKRGVIGLHLPNEKGMTEATTSRVLGLESLPFVAQGPPICAAFSRANLSGSKCELSGSELFNSIVLPLVKAYAHAFAMYSPDVQYSNPHSTLVLPIGVVDAPMVLVDNPQSPLDPILTPWVRIVRHESRLTPDGWHQIKYYGIDVVHIDYFDTFIENHVMPFAAEFGRRCSQMADVLLRGGTIPNLQDWSWDQIRPRNK